MRIVVVMDGPETVNPESDTSFGLMLAAKERGHEIWHCGPRDIEWADDTVWAIARRAHADENGTPPLTLADPERCDLGQFDAVLIRPDPPFDATYLQLTLLLDLLGDRTLVVNRPQGLRDANEKLYACRFPDVTPPTIVTADTGRIDAFAADHGSAVIKPIDGHGGRGVMVVRPGDPNAPSIIDTMTERGTTPVIAQAYLDGVGHGDKRILLLDGDPLGAILRLPTDTDFRANICVGGRTVATELDDADHRIIERIAPDLRRDGLHFVGIDVIDGRLTEVNVTSPTGLRQMGRLSGTRPDLQVIEWLEQRTA